VAIIGVYETFDARGGKVATNRLREYSRSFNVISSIRNEDPIAVRLAPGIPPPWSPYVNTVGFADLGSWCKEVTVRQDRLDPYTWRVEARYSSQVDRPDINQIENPLLRPAEIEWDTVTRERIIMADIDGDPIVTVNDERFDPPPMDEEKILQLTVTRNQAGYNALEYVKYENAVNSDTFLSFPAGRVKCVRIKGGRQFENGVLFWRVTFQFHFRIRLDETDDEVLDADASRRAWQLKILHQGYWKVDAGKRLHVTDAQGRPSPTPRLLDADGTQLAAGEDPVFLYFDTRPERNFALLGLF
jgi:hypothetical protein